MGWMMWAASPTSASRSAMKLRAMRIDSGQAARGPITATLRTHAARAFSNRKLLQQHREAHFQHFGIGQSAVGHVALYHRGAGEVRARTGAARDRLVILVAIVAEGEIVHCPLRRRLRAQRAEQCVGDDLARLDIPCDDRGGVLGLSTSQLIGVALFALAASLHAARSRGLLRVAVAR